MLSPQRHCLFTLAACISVSLTALPASADGPKGTAVIKGKVVFAGTPPKVKPLNISEKACAKLHKNKKVPAQGLIVYKKQANAVPFVFVYVKKGISEKYDPPQEPALINQVGCMYEPHVLGMVAGQELHIRNGDSTPHNINSLAKKNPAFNYLQSNKNMTKKLVGPATFNKHEVMIKITCDIHSWMSCYVGVLTHPFFDVTKPHLPKKDQTPETKAARGTFEIKDLPAGDYVLEAWHEKFGRVTHKVSVKDGETKEIEIKIGEEKT